jgi:hypothetical protein
VRRDTLLRKNVINFYMLEGPFIKQGLEGVGVVSKQQPQISIKDCEERDK